jgi:arabinose-5-phosphate isomerase
VPSAVPLAKAEAIGYGIAMKRAPNETSTETRPATARETAERVLRLEGEAVLALAEGLPEDFETAVEAILATHGRVIVSGIGKSGHIARKISSTFASTGTPSAFVHPAEASHGDLGMVMPGDLAILISNSGETAELRDIVAHVARFSIPLVAISARRESTLMQAADFRLTLPPAPEACALGMAPTTSTTMTLALGDALAVAVMERRGFLPEQFRTFHPGGKLGARLSKVAQLMHGPEALPLVDAGRPMPETLVVMSEKGFGIAGVTEGGRLVGVISDGDLRRNMAHLMERCAGDVATRNPRVIAPDLLAVEALAMMSENKITALFVTDAEGVPIGILHLHDCLRAGLV